MSFITKWKDKVTEYVEVRLQLAKLSFIERTASILGYLVFSFVALCLLLPILIFLGIGLAEVFTNCFDSRVVGYFMTVGVYILLMVILILLRKTIISTFAGIFIMKLTDDDDDDKKEQK